MKALFSIFVSFFFCMRIPRPLLVRFDQEILISPPIPSTSSPPFPGRPPPLNFLLFSPKMVEEVYISFQSKASPAYKWRRRLPSIFPCSEASLNLALGRFFFPFPHARRCPYPPPTRCFCNPITLVLPPITSPPIRRLTHYSISCCFIP